MDEEDGGPVTQMNRTELTELNQRPRKHFPRCQDTLVVVLGRERNGKGMGTDDAGDGENFCVSLWVAPALEARLPFIQLIIATARISHLIRTIRVSRNGATLNF